MNIINIKQTINYYGIHYIIGRHAPWIDCMLRVPIRHWDGINLNSVIDTDKRESIRRGDANILQVSQVASILS